MQLEAWKSCCVFFSLFFAYVLVKNMQRQRKGAIFFLSALSLAPFGILSSNDIFFCLVNKASFSLMCFYVVLAAVVSTKTLDIFMDGLFRLSGARPLRFYLLLTALASFIPSKKMHKQMLAFLKSKKREEKKQLHAFFPVVFVLASSLTLVGSVTNIVSDYIFCEILQGTRWMFFSFGPLSLSLFFISFVFFFAVQHLHKKQRRLAFSSIPEIPFSSSSDATLVVLKNDVPTSFEDRKRGDSFRQTFMPLLQNPGKNRAVAAVFLLLMVFVAAGIQLFIAAPIAAAILLLCGAFKGIDMSEELPWDLFLLVAAAFMYCRAFIDSGALESVLLLLQGTHSKEGLLTFFLFSSGLLSLLLPPLIVIAFLLPVASATSAACSLHFQEHLAAAITLGSFFLFPKRSLVVLDKMKLTAEEKIHLAVLQGVWIAIVFLVFLFHCVD